MSSMQNLLSWIRTKSKKARSNEERPQLYSAVPDSPDSPVRERQLDRGSHPSPDLPFRGSQGSLRESQGAFQHGSTRNSVCRSSMKLPPLPASCGEVTCQVLATPNRRLRRPMMGVASLRTDSPAHIYEEIPNHLVDDSQSSNVDISNGTDTVNVTNLDFAQAKEFGSFLVVPIRSKACVDNRSLTNEQNNNKSEVADNLHYDSSSHSDTTSKCNGHGPNFHHSSNQENLQFTGHTLVSSAHIHRHEKITRTNSEPIAHHNFAHHHHHDRHHSHADRSHCSRCSRPHGIFNGVSLSHFGDEQLDPESLELQTYFNKQMLQQAEQPDGSVVERFLIVPSRPEFTDDVFQEGSNENGNVEVGTIEMNNVEATVLTADSLQSSAFSHLQSVQEFGQVQSSQLTHGESGHLPHNDTSDFSHTQLDVPNGRQPADLTQSSDIISNINIQSSAFTCVQSLNNQQVQSSRLQNFSGNVPQIQTTDLTQIVQPQSDDNDTGNEYDMRSSDRSSTSQSRPGSYAFDSGSSLYAFSNNEREAMLNSSSGSSGIGGMPSARHRPLESDSSNDTFSEYDMYPSPEYEYYLSKAQHNLWFKKDVMRVIRESSSEYETTSDVTSPRCQCGKGNQDNISLTTVTSLSDLSLSDKDGAERVPKPKQQSTQKSEYGEKCPVCDCRKETRRHRSKTKSKHSGRVRSERRQAKEGSSSDASEVPAWERSDRKPATKHSSRKKSQSKRGAELYCLPDFSDAGSASMVEEPERLSCRATDFTPPIMKNTHTPKSSSMRHSHAVDTPSRLQHRRVPQQNRMLTDLMKMNHDRLLVLF